MSIERGFEREERAVREVIAYESLDRMTTMRSLGLPATLERIIPEQAKHPARLDASGSVPAESFGSESVDLAGPLTEGEG